MATQLDYDEESLFNHVDYDGAFEFQPNGWDNHNWLTLPAQKGDLDQDMFPYDSYLLLYSNEDKLHTYLQSALYSTNYFT